MLHGILKSALTEKNEQMIQNCIALFCTENLAEMKNADTAAQQSVLAGVWDADMSAYASNPQYKNAKMYCELKADGTGVTYFDPNGTGTYTESPFTFYAYDNDGKEDVSSGVYISTDSEKLTKASKYAITKKGEATILTFETPDGSSISYIKRDTKVAVVSENTTLYVKGSGTQLATIKAEEFVKMDRARLNEIMKTEYPADDVKRESAYLADVMAAVTDEDKTKRPSVEALLHNLFAYTYVLHVHPTLINGLTCGKGAKALSEQLLGKDVLWIDICKPGYTLARICFEKMNAYKEETGKDVQVLLLQNHGIFVAADTVEEIGVLFDSVIEKLEKQVKRTADVSNAVTPEKEQAAEKLSRLLGHRVEVVPAAEADNFVKDKTAAAPLLKPFTPDHIVYCGPYPLFVENIDEAKSALDAFMAENDKEPRLILVQGVGAFIMEDDKGKAAKAQLLVKDAIKLAVYAESFGGPLQMTDEITYFITHWEAEAYRSKK